QSLSSSASIFSSGSARASPSPNSRASIPAASRCLCRITSRRSSPSGNAARSPQPRPCGGQDSSPTLFTDGSDRCSKQNIRQKYIVLLADIFTLKLHGDAVLQCQTAVSADP